jgi:hypothetical protein
MGDAGLSRANGQRTGQAGDVPTRMMGGWMAVLCWADSRWSEIGDLTLACSLAWCAVRELERTNCRVLCQQPSLLQVCERTDKTSQGET